MTFVPYDRPVRAAVIGLGRIFDLNIRAYADNPDVEVVALVDPDPERRAQRRAEWPRWRRSPRPPNWRRAGLRSTRPKSCCRSRSTPRGSRNARLRVAPELAKANVQRSLRRSADDRGGTGHEPSSPRHGELLFYEPLRRLKETVESGEIGTVSGYHMKMVGSGTRRLGRAHVQLQVAVRPNAPRPRRPRVRRRVAQACDGPVALRPAEGGTGMGGKHRSPADDCGGRSDHHHMGAPERSPRCVGHHPGARHVPALRLLHQ